MKFRLIHVLVVSLVLMFGCIEVEDIEDIATSTDVDERFEDSVSGDTKTLFLPESSDESFVFLWMTDMHIQYSKENYFKDLALYAQEESVKPRFILHSGDLVDNGDEDEYVYVEDEIRRYLEPVNLPFISAIGNHDLSGDGWDAWKEYIGPSVFSFNYGNTFFIIIDTANATVGEDQMEWIEEQLEESDMPNKIMLSHFPFYDGTYETPTLMGDPDERMKLMYLVEEYGVDYVLTGHKHSIEKHDIGDAVYMSGGTASAQKDAINGDALFYRFEIDGDDIDYDKVYFDDL